MSKVEVNVPDGYEIDKENSTPLNIKLKLRDDFTPWRNNDKSTVGGFFIGLDSSIKEAISNFKSENNRNVFYNMRYAKMGLALAQITQIMKHDDRFGVISDDEWIAGDDQYVISRVKDEVLIIKSNVYNILAFHTYDQAELFWIENKDLVKDYLLMN